MSISSPRIDFSKVVEIAQNAIDNFPVCADVLGLKIHKKIIDTLGLNRDSKILNIGAGAYNQQFPDSLVQVLPPTNLIVCDLNIAKLNSWKIFWHDAFGYDDGSVTPICADAMNLPFGDCSIDFVYSANLINDPGFTKKPKAVELFLREGMTVLRPGGKIFLNSFGYLIGDIQEGEYCFNCDPSEILEPKELHDLMEKVGFIEIAHQKPSRKIIQEILEESTQVRKMKQDGCSDIRLIHAGGIIASKS